MFDFQNVRNASLAKEVLLTACISRFSQAMITVQTEWEGPALKSAPKKSEEV